MLQNYLNDLTFIVSLDIFIRWVKDIISHSFDLFKQVSTVDVKWIFVTSNLKFLQIRTKTTIYTYIQKNPEW